jgi:hypothetical protein
LPSQELIVRYPETNELYGPFIDAIKSGNVKKFEEALLQKEKILVSFETFLTVELAREISIRILFKKVLVSIVILYNTSSQFYNVLNSK